MNEHDLAQISDLALNRPENDPAIEYDRHWFSWGGLKGVANRISELIEASGAKPGSRIALVARNRPSAIAAYLGLLQQRRAVRMVYPFQSAAALARDLEAIAPAVVIAAEGDFQEDVLKLLESQGIAAIALSEMDAHALPSLEKTQNRGPLAPHPQLEILTSGTTGTPKPFALDYDTVARHIVSAGAAAGVDPAQLPPAVMFFPVGNITGLHSCIAPLLRGQRGVLFDRFSVEGWHDHLVRFRPTAGGLPPAGLQMILDADLPREDFSSLKMIGTGSAPLDPSVQRAFEERYGVPIILAYGATEFGGPVAGMSLELHAQWGDKKRGSVGKAYPGASLRVVDAETGEELPAGEEGALEVISPRIGPQWIRTSDIAVIDEDGFLFLRGRADGAIMRGGFKILPETIEKALRLHPAVAAVGVVGVPDHRLGQVPAAAVQLKPGATDPSFTELEAHLRQHVPATHIPVHWLYVSELPRTPSYKVNQPALRELFETV